MESTRPHQIKQGRFRGKREEYVLAGAATPGSFPHNSRSVPEWETERASATREGYDGKTFVDGALVTRLRVIPKSRKERAA